MLTPGAVRIWYNTCIYFQDVKDFLFCAIVVIITNYAAAEKKTTVTCDVTKDKGSGKRADFGISHKRGNWKFDGSGFSTSKGHRGGSLGVLHKRKKLEFGGSVFGDNRGTRGGPFGVSHKRNNFEFGASIFGDNRGNRGAGIGFKWRFRRSTQWVRLEFIYVNNCF